MSLSSSISILRRAYYFQEKIETHITLTTHDFKEKTGFRPGLHEFFKKVCAVFEGRFDKSLLMLLLYSIHTII